MVKVGVIFSNLGTPASPSAKDVATYLREFLMDPYVLTFPWFYRFLLVHGVIAPFRSKKTAKNYQKIWLKEGSPLRVNTERAALALQNKLGAEYKVVTAMRYGAPSFLNAREQLKDCDEIVLFQQYPQFADSVSTTGEEHFKKAFKDFKYKIIPAYYNHPSFIKSYVEFLKPQLENLDFDHLLLSFHGLPESHLKSADPTGQHCLMSEDCCAQAQPVIHKCYKAQCRVTAQLLMKGLGFATQSYSVSFQSRVGREKWIGPYTEDMYKELVERGVKKLAVVCPGFSVDGLETLEEIAIGGKEIFLSHGGEEFHYLPCLNNDPGWVAACAEILLET